MIDRERVAEIIDDGDPLRGAGILADLEAAGYRVVRAGMVPDITPLNTMQARLVALAQLDEAIYTPQRAASGARDLARLRELAVAVLGIDPDDVDEVAE